MGLQLTEPYRAEARFDVILYVVCIGFLRTGLDRAAILIEPYFKPITQRHSLRFQIGSSIYRGRDSPELFRDLRRGFPIEALAVRLAGSRISTSAIPDLP